MSQFDSKPAVQQQIQQQQLSSRSHYQKQQLSPRALTQADVSHPPVPLSPHITHVQMSGAPNYPGNQTNTTGSANASGSYNTTGQPNNCPEGCNATGHPNNYPEGYNNAMYTYQRPDFKYQSFNEISNRAPSYNNTDKATNANSGVASSIATAPTLCQYVLPTTGNAPDAHTTYVKCGSSQMAVKHEQYLPLQDSDGNLQEVESVEPKECNFNSVNAHYIDCPAFGTDTDWLSGLGNRSTCSITEDYFPARTFYSIPYRLTSQGQNEDSSFSPFGMDYSDTFNMY